MISYLKVRNLAIVEEFAIEPGSALNVLTGETGAGKSLLIDSLEFLSGARGSSDSIRSGAEKMSAEAIFHLPGETGQLMAVRGIEMDESGELIVRREISTNGRGRVLLNGSPVAVRDLVGAMESIIEIHGQNESHQRIAGQSFRELLDQYGDHRDQIDRTASAYRSWGEAQAQLEELRGAVRDRELRLDLLKYQIDEIGKARLDPAEEEELRTERTLLTHSGEILTATAGSFMLLDEDDSSALAQIGRARSLLHPLSSRIESVAGMAEELEEIRIRLQELSRSLSAMGDSVRHDPRRLDEIEDRLALIERLKKKYGGSIEEVLRHFQKSSEELEQLNDHEMALAKLETAESKAFDAYADAAGNLSERRRTASAEFQAAIQAELNDLAMERTTVRLELTTLAARDSRLMLDGRETAFGPEGYDRIEILIAPNRGEEPRPMQKIASGGELSRIQLAIAAALFKHSPHSAAATLVFDEIDAGIGGAVAEVVGRKLRELAAANQVICVTHLPQIAGFGSTHFRVWKEDSAGHTRARIARLDSAEERVDEIARMLGGTSVTESAKAHARELLERGQAASQPV
ncbi:MAG TPA: DNA repair protein RecN [Thermoanaerobaculia bacterium]|nr:DNA repair protein RecN [Thermoanaerobaculia bacterium]